MTGRVVVAGCWDAGPGYPRTGSLIAALRAIGHEVDERRVEGPKLRGSKSALVARPWRWPAWWLASRGARRRLQAELRAARAAGDVTAVVVPYPGHAAVRWVREVFDGPIVLDLFLSAHGTSVGDRALFRPGSLPARALLAIDRRACEAADLVLLDTPEHAELVCRETGLPADRFDWVPVSDEVVAASPLPPLGASTPLRVVCFGTGVPLHGLDTWIDALVATEGVQVEWFGGDPLSRERASRALDGRIVMHAPFVPMAAIRAAIDRSHVVAGIFGSSAKAAAVVPFKVVHGLAHGRAVVTADTPAIRRLLEPGVDCVVAPAGDAAALARELGALAQDGERLAAVARAGRARFERSFGPSAVAARLAGVLRPLCAPSSARAVTPETAWAVTA